MKKTFAILIMIVLFIFSASTVFGASGIVIKNIDKKIVVEKLIEDLITKNYTIVSTSEYQVTVSQQLKGALKFAYGTRINPNPIERTTFNIVQINADVKITIDEKIVVNPNSGFERSEDNLRHPELKFLLNLQQYFNGINTFGIGAISNGEYGYIIYWVGKDSDAEAQGIKIPDRQLTRLATSIISINGKKASKVKQAEWDALMDQPNGSTITIMIKSNNKKREYTLTKKIIAAEYIPTN
jgi:hypothetical protein